MNEFIEKLIGRLEEELKTAREMQTTQCILHDGYGTPLQSKLGGEICALLKVQNIVNQLAEEYNNDVCEWRLCDEEANVYDTTCRNPHILIEGSPTDNNYEYCPYCGKKIKIAPYQPKGE